MRGLFKGSVCLGKWVFWLCGQGESPVWKVRQSVRVWAIFDAVARFSLRCAAGAEKLALMQIAATPDHLVVACETREAGLAFLQACLGAPKVLRGICHLA